MMTPAAVPAPLFTPKLSTSTPALYFHAGSGDVWALDLNEAARLALLLRHTTGDERPADWEPSTEDYLESGRVIARSAADLEAERFPYVLVRINGAETKVFVIERGRMLLLVRPEGSKWAAECFADFAAFDFAGRLLEHRS